VTTAASIVEGRPKRKAKDSTESLRTKAQSVFPNEAVHEPDGRRRTVGLELFHGRRPTLDFTTWPMQWPNQKDFLNQTNNVKKIRPSPLYRRRLGGQGLDAKPAQPFHYPTQNRWPPIHAIQWKDLKHGITNQGKAKCMATQIPVHLAKRRILRRAVDPDSGYPATQKT